jgi:hypothetical protein
MMEPWEDGSGPYCPHWNNPDGTCQDCARDLLQDELTELNQKVVDLNAKLGNAENRADAERHFREFLFKLKDDRERRYRSAVSAATLILREFARQLGGQGGASLERIANSFDGVFEWAEVGDGNQKEGPQGT